MNDTELIKKVCLKIARQSKLDFLLHDIETIIKDAESRLEMIEKLKKALINANYAGDYEAGTLSFYLDYYLKNYDVREELEKILEESGTWSRLFFVFF